MLESVVCILEKAAAMNLVLKMAKTKPTEQVVHVSEPGTLGVISESQGRILEFHHGTRLYLSFCILTLPTLGPTNWVRTQGAVSRRQSMCEPAVCDSVGEPYTVWVRKSRHARSLTV